MNDKNLKRALFVAIGLCTLLAAALAYTVSHREGRVHAQDDSDPVVASGPADAKPGTKASIPTNVDESPLTPIQLSPRRLQEIGVTTALVEMKETSSEVQAPGSVAINEQRLSSVQTRFPGWIRTVFANATYQYVKKGQSLFTIYSPDLVSTEQEVLLAKQNQATSSEHMHGTPANEGNWLLQAAEERLRRFDVPEAEIARIEQSGSVERELAIQSPASGYIIERNALPNAYVQPDTKLYTIADLSTVWVYANVFQTDIGRLKPGDHAEVTVNAYPGRKFNGRIDQILPDVDQATRTVRVRLIFSNPGILLKPGMYVDVDMSAPLGRRLVIPSSGVLQAGNRQIAFIDHGQGSLEPREIETGPRLDDSIVVLKGLRAGDRIVSSANFLIDSEAQLQGSMGGFAPLPTAANTEQKSTEQFQVALTTQPSPPRKGQNSLRVNLTGADGKPVAGAEVSVTFFMPAMPAMGMSSMRAASTLADKGQGVYEGSVQLGAGGTWDVTVTATRNGQAVANKKLSVNAAGGMY
jgi:Cu(I)/Ag(I) efflux system membrane fusion protein/cobalt-zinc-cadmium efflux system membrane fusion protein